MKKYILLLCCLCVTYSSLQANSLTLYDLTKNIQSVRTRSMGDAYTAIAEGEGAIHSNPAGLSYPGGIYTYQYFDYDGTYNRRNQGYFFYTRPFGYSKISIEDLTGNTATLTTFGYGRQGKNGVSWGINYKAVESTIDGINYEGWSSDFGILMKLTPSLSLGGVVKDIYAKSISVPTTAQVGISGSHKKNSFIWSADLAYDDLTHKEINPKYGFELSLTDSLAIRSGYSDRTVNAGLNLHAMSLQFDLGMSNDLDDGLGTRYFIATNIGSGAKTQQYRKRYAIFKPSAYAEFSLGSNLKQGKSEVSLLGGYKVGSNDLINLIHIANDDPTCEGYIIRIGNMSSSLSKVGLIQEIRNELKKGKSLGKKIFVYIEHSASLPEYYIASLADMIILPPLGSISQFGLDIEITKTTEFLNKLGIKPNVITSGEFKGVTGMTSDDLNDIDKEQLRSIVENLFHQVVDDIQKDKASVSPSLDYLKDGKMITATEAKDLGLVDRLAYWPDVYDIINEYDDTIEKLSITEFAPLQGPSILTIFNRIAVIEIDGTINLGNNSSNLLFGGTNTGADEFDDIVSKVIEDFSVKGVILRINSPGGSVLAADRIYMAVDRLKNAGKLVYASMGSMATSGGYYVALNSDKIYANNGSLTGSVGVISSLTTFSGLQKELGIKRDVIKTGKYMDIYSSSKSLSSEEKQLIQQHQDHFYQEFVHKVKQNRKLTDDEAYNIAQGQIITGEQAVELKMVDEIGTFYDVIDDMAETLDIQDPELVFVRSKPQFDIPIFSSGIMSKWWSTFNPTTLLKYILNK